MNQRWYSTNGFLLIRELKHLTPETCALSTVPLARTVTDGYEWNLDIYIYSNPRYKHVFDNLQYIPVYALVITTSHNTQINEIN